MLFGCIHGLFKESVDVADVVRADIHVEDGARHEKAGDADKRDRVGEINSVVEGKLTEIP